SDGGWQVDFHTTGAALEYKDEGIEALVDFALAVGGALSKPNVTGNISVSQGRFDLLRLPGRSQSGASGGGGGGGLRPLFDPAVDIDIDISAAQVSAGTFLQGEVAGTLGLKGSVREPQIFGDISLVRGDFRYLGSRFEATSGSVAFRGSNLPNLQVAG